MSETIEQFCDRILHVYNYPRADYYLVWKSKKDKQDIIKFPNPEKWSLEKVRNYLAWLENQNDMDN